MHEEAPPINILYQLLLTNDVIPYDTDEPIAIQIVNRGKRQETVAHQEIYPLEQPHIHLHIDPFGGVSWAVAGYSPIPVLTESAMDLFVTIEPFIKCEEELASDTSVRASELQTGVDEAHHSQSDGYDCQDVCERHLDSSRT